MGMRCGSAAYHWTEETIMYGYDGMMGGKGMGWGLGSFGGICLLLILMAILSVALIVRRRRNS